MDQTALVNRHGESSSICATQVCHFAGDGLNSPVGHFASPLRKRKHRGLLWGMGGTILSGLGFVALALFEQYNGMLSELRNDLKHFNETSGEYVKRDHLQRLRDQFKECIKELQASSAGRAQLEQELRTSEKAREELAHELQRMHERLAFVEGKQTAIATAGLMNPPARK